MGKTNSSMLTCKGQESQGQHKAGALRKEWPKGLAPWEGDMTPVSTQRPWTELRVSLDWNGGMRGVAVGSLRGVCQV